jgi:hypothetical protein
MVILRTFATFTTDAHSSLLFTVDLHRDIFGTYKSFSVSSSHLRLGVLSFSIWLVCHEVQSKGYIYIYIYIYIRIYILLY